MFIHCTESGQKEAKRLIFHIHRQGFPKLDSGADVSAIQLVGYRMSSEEIGDIYHQVYMLKRLPGPSLCGPERAWKITKDNMSSLEDCLRWRRGEQSGGGREQEPTSTHLSCHWNWASQRGRHDTLGEWELAKAREAHQQALAAVALLEECIERLSQWTTRTGLDICHHSQSWDQPSRRSWGQSCRHRMALPEEGHQAQSPPLSDINRSLSWTQEQHMKKNKYLGRSLLILIWGPHWSWGWILSTSCRSQLPCKRRMSRALSCKGPQWRTMKIELEGVQGPHTLLVARVSGDPQNQWLPSACSEDMSLFWAPLSEEWSPGCWQLLVSTTSPQVHLPETIPTTSESDVPHSGF